MAELTRSRPETRREISARLLKGASDCGCGSVKDTPRRVDIEVERCTYCPFMICYSDDFTVSQMVNDNVREPYTETIRKGWYCLHPARRDRDNLLATYKMVKDSPDHVVGLDSWLKHHERALFPSNCPLTKPVVLKEHSGHRLIDITA